MLAQLAEQFHNWPVDLGPFAAWVTVAVALVAAVNAYRSYRIQRATQSRADQRFSLYLADQYLVHFGGSRTYVFRLVITNSATTANSINRVALRIEFDSRRKPAADFSVDHDATATDGIQIDSIAPVLTLPKSFGAGEAIAGTAIFRVPDELITGDVESYAVSVVDGLGRETAQGVIVLREIRK
jgi:hypothetical protein